MPLVRILVDGYSLLHAWPDIAKGKARHSAAARDELIHLLIQYQDAIGTPITVVFDGSGAPAGTPKAHSTPEMEILFSSAGHTADDIIERAAHRLRAYGEVLVVTNDGAERETIGAVGAAPMRCEHFISVVTDALRELESDLKRLNTREVRKFHTPGK